VIIPQKSVKNDIFKTVKQVKCLAIPMKTRYNISNKTALAEPFLNLSLQKQGKEHCARCQKESEFYTSLWESTISLTLEESFLFISFAKS